VDRPQPDLGWPPLYLVSLKAIVQKKASSR
jgi:hypothetical protein